MSNQPLLEIQDLHISFFIPSGEVKAVNSINLTLQAGEMFGLVGETGCGKTITGLSILRLIPSPGKITQGLIIFKGKNLLSLSEAAMQEMRGREISMIFQNALSSLNPVFTIENQLVRVIRRHSSLSKKAARDRAMETLAAVGLPDPKRLLKAYPHQLSGGMQQRAMIAMALSCEPTLLIADEPTTALDVTIQAQILDLLRDLQTRLGITVLLITHDLGVIAETCERLAVLYAGSTVEVGSVAEIFNRPMHPYTQGLLAALPDTSQRGQKLNDIPGTVPHNPGLLPGCLFASRCPYAWEQCVAERPPLYRIGETQHTACFLQASGWFTHSVMTKRDI